jgi:hypothetical protein
MEIKLRTSCFTDPSDFQFMPYVLLFYLVAYGAGTGIVQ